MSSQQKFLSGWPISARYRILGLKLVNPSARISVGWGAKSGYHIRAEIFTFRPSGLVFLPYFTNEHVVGSYSQLSCSGCSTAAVRCPSVNRLDHLWRRQASLALLHYPLVLFFNFSLCLDFSWPIWLPVYPKKPSHDPNYDNNNTNHGSRAPHFICVPEKILGTRAD